MIRLYRWLLALYPAAFRRDYGEEMVAIFREQVAGVGFFGRVARLAGAAADVVLNAAPMHGELLRQDLASAARTVRRAPAFAATVVVIAALGVGANTAAFSVADFVLVQPLPFHEPDRVVRLCALTALAGAGLPALRALRVSPLSVIQAE